MMILVLGWHELSVSRQAAVGRRHKKTTENPRRSRSRSRPIPLLPFIISVCLWVGEPLKPFICSLLLSKLQPCLYRRSLEQVVHSFGYLQCHWRWYYMVRMQSTGWKAIAQHLHKSMLFLERILSSVFLSTNAICCGTGIPTCPN